MDLGLRSRRLSSFRMEARRNERPTRLPASVAPHVLRISGRLLHHSHPLVVSTNQSSGIPITHFVSYLETTVLINQVRIGPYCLFEEGKISNLCSKSPPKLVPQTQKYASRKNWHSSSRELRRLPSIDVKLLGDAMSGGAFKLAGSFDMHEERAVGSAACRMRMHPSKFQVFGPIYCFLEKWSCCWHQGGQ